MYKYKLSKLIKYYLLSLIKFSLTLINLFVFTSLLHKTSKISLPTKPCRHFLRVAGISMLTYYINRFKKPDTKYMTYQCIKEKSWFLWIYLLKIIKKKKL